MIMKSILTISCFVVMVLANQTEDRNISPVRLRFLKEDMHDTCSNLTNGNCRIVNEVVFETNCKKAAYQDTFCQVNLALLNCKGYDSKIFSGMLPGNNANCTLKTSLITLKDFCSKVIFYIDSLYRRCSLKKRKRALFNIA